ncbi:MAG: hypothetical protein AB7O62_18510 [Pirellulales bacterium]
MRCIRSLEKLARFFTYAAMAVGVFAGSSSAYAANPCYNYCPPCYNGVPGAAMDAAGQPTDAAGQPTDAGAAAQPQANNDLNLAPQNSQFQQAASGEGSNVGHIGRADNLNRLNIFDSQSAIPANRVWFGFQYVDRFQFNQGAAASAVYQSLYRAGGELMVTDTSSISFQGQYAHVNSSLGAASSDFTNPQIMGKQVLYQDCDLTVSATLGLLIPVGGNRTSLSLRENQARLAPGLLWYYNTSDDFFNYGGFQYSAPLTDNEVSTFDWSIGTGYWLYQSCCCCDWLQKVSLQYEVFGKHIVGGTNSTGFGPIVGPGTGSIVETRDALDMTFGTSFFMRDGIRVSLGYSIPVSTRFARRNELIATLGYYF